MGITNRTFVLMQLVVLHHPKPNLVADTAQPTILLPKCRCRIAIKIIYIGPSTGHKVPPFQRVFAESFIKECSLTSHLVRS